MKAPQRLRAAMKRLVARARESLDIPSREEVIDLADRLAEIDRKLALFQEQRAAANSSPPRTRAPAERKKKVTKPSEPRAKKSAKAKPDSKKAGASAKNGSTATKTKRSAPRNGKAAASAGKPNRTPKRSSKPSAPKSKA